MQFFCRWHSSRTSQAQSIDDPSLENTNETWTIDSQQQWERNTDDDTGLEIKDGMARPIKKESTFLSKIKSFSKKRSVSSIAIDQSPEWSNWEPIGGIGPTNLGDAPVMLQLGPDNYWMFGRYGKQKGKKKPGKFVAEEAKLEGFDVPLLTTPFPNQFDAPGGLKPKLGGYHAWQSKDMKNWVHHGAITEQFFEMDDHGRIC